MNKKIIIGIVVLLAAVAAWYFFIRKPQREPTAAEIANLEKYILNDPKALQWKTDIQDRATRNNVSFEARLRQEVISSLRKSINK